MQNNKTVTTVNHTVFCIIRTTSSGLMSERFDKGRNRTTFANSFIIVSRCNSRDRAILSPPRRHSVEIRLGPGRRRAGASASHRAQEFRVEAIVCVRARLFSRNRGASYLRDGLPILIRVAFVVGDLFYAFVRRLGLFFFSIIFFFPYIIHILLPLRNFPSSFTHRCSRFTRPAVQRLFEFRARPFRNDIASV